MKYVVIMGLILITTGVGWALKNIVWPAIKRDPVANLILPAATALVTNLLIQLLKTQL